MIDHQLTRNDAAGSGNHILRGERRGQNNVAELTAQAKRSTAHQHKVRLSSRDNLFRCQAADVRYRPVGVGHAVRTPSPVPSPPSLKSRGGEEVGLRDRSDSEVECHSPSFTVNEIFDVIRSGALPSARATDAGRSSFRTAMPQCTRCHRQYAALTFPTFD